MVIMLGCGMCVQSMARLLYPALDWALGILALWLVVLLILEWRRPGSILPIIRQNRLAIVLVSFFLMAFIGTALFFPLFAIFLLTARVDLSKRSDAPPRALKTIHIITAILILAVSVPAYVEWSQLDRLGKFRRYVHPGTGPARDLAEKIGRDPTFSPKMLRPMLDPDDSADSDKAFDILMQRKNVTDLIALEDAILSYPPSDYTLNPNSQYTYLPLWLDSLGAKGITTTSGLSDFIAAEREKLSTE
jgi:hypothetical protein